MLVSFPFYKLTLLVVVSSLAHEGLALSNDSIREDAPRLRAQGGFSNLQATLRVFQQLQETSPTDADTEKGDGEDALAELMESLNVDETMSMDTMDPTTDSPTDAPTDLPSGAPTVAPTTFTPPPTVSAMPSLSPSVSQAPSPSEPTTASPTAAPTIAPTAAPTIAPTEGPGVIPITTDLPTVSPSLRPTSSPSISPTQLPSSAPTEFPTTTPTVEGCTISADVRVAAIMAILDSNADPTLIRDISTAQGQATNWLLNVDPRKLCPDNPKILQRWVLAVTYFSTGGDDWFQCSNSIFANDNCGNEGDPFMDKQRFLSGFSECDWAGITCTTLPSGLDCVTEIEFELNNLIGTIPTEIGLLTDLEVWGMERGGLTGTIPTEIEFLSNLIFLDLDFNQLTGSLTTELLSLASLEQLDLNDNLFTGSINDIGVFPNIVFLQLHRNMFTGTVPTEVGSFVSMATFTLHANQISGVMPQSVCNLLQDGELGSLIADCRGNNADIECDCCTDCRNENQALLL